MQPANGVLGKEGEARDGGKKLCTECPLGLLIEPVTHRVLKESPQLHTTEVV